MTKETSIKLFETKKVRTIWDEENEKWWFSVVERHCGLVSVRHCGLDPQSPEQEGMLKQVQHDRHDGHYTYGGYCANYNKTKAA